MIETKKIDVIANITNNIIKGICIGKTLIALQGSSRSGKSYNTMILLIQCLLRTDFANNLYRLNWLARYKEQDWEHTLNQEELKNRKLVLQRKLARKAIRVTVVRKTMPSIKNTIYLDFKNIMLDMGVWEEKCMNKTDMVYTFPNGSTLEFFATADNEQKIRGAKRDICFCNEGNELDEMEYKQLRMRTEDFTIIDFNPTFPEEHWLFAVINEPRTYHFISTFLDNPLLSDAQKDEILSYKYTSPAHWKIYGCGEFAIIEGLVYPKETYDICQITDIPVNVKVEQRIGIDVGFSGRGDPTAAILCYFANIDSIKHLWMQELIYEKGLNEKMLAYRLKPYNGIPKYIDSANPLYMQNLEDNGIQLLRPVKKYANSVIEGINKVQGYKLHIIKPSVNIQKEFNNYTWLKDRHDNFTNQPIDKFNHACDAIRYAVMSDRSARGGNLKHRYTKSELNLTF